MKKGFKKIIILLLIGVFLVINLFPLALIHADEIDAGNEDKTTEVIDIEDEEDALNVEKSEIAKWWDEKVMPQILMVVTSMTGTTIVAVILRSLVKKTISSIKERFEKQIESSAKNEKDYKERIELLEETCKVLEKKLVDAITQKMGVYEKMLEEALAKLDVQSDEYKATKEKCEQLGNKMLEVFGNEEAK